MTIALHLGTQMALFLEAEHLLIGIMNNLLVGTGKQMVAQQLQMMQVQLVWEQLIV